MEKPLKVYHVGDVVEVFEDPITTKVLEGKAKIVKGYGNHYYDVVFLGDGEPVVRRRIL